MTPHDAYTITPCPDNLFNCLINGISQRWSDAKKLIPRPDIERLMRAQMTGAELAITVNIEPQPVAVKRDEFVEPGDSEFLAMFRGVTK